VLGKVLKGDVSYLIVTNLPSSAELEELSGTVASVAADD
jgi:hypothetical protein